MNKNLQNIIYFLTNQEGRALRYLLYEYNCDLKATTSRGVNRGSKGKSPLIAIKAMWQDNFRKLEPYNVKP